MGRIDLEHDAAVNIASALDADPDVFQLIPTLVAAGARSNYVDERVEALRARPGPRRLEKISEELSGAFDWLDQVATPVREQVIDEQFLALYDGAQFFFNLKMLEARLRGGQPVQFVPPGDYYRWRFDRLLTSGGVRPGRSISISQRLQCMPIATLRIFTKKRGMKGATKQLLASQLESDPVLVSTMNRFAGNFFMIPALEFDFDSFLSEFAELAILASVLIETSLHGDPG